MKWADFKEQWEKHNPGDKVEFILSSYSLIVIRNDTDIVEIDIHKHRVYLSDDIDSWDVENMKLISEMLDTPPYLIDDDNSYWAPIYDKESPDPVGFIVPNGDNENEFTIHIGSKPELGYGVYKQCDFPFDNHTMNRLSQKWKPKE